jgi:hypothetical protein
MQHLVKSFSGKGGYLNQFKTVVIKLNGIVTPC